jgi:predicted O-methyltransferase YrrM
VDASKGQYIEFLPDCKRLIKNNGVIITDNIFCQGLVLEKQQIARRKRTMVRKVNEYIEVLMGSSFKTSLISIGDGIAISVKG